jgi:hypothetical protein
MMTGVLTAVPLLLLLLIAATLAGACAVVGGLLLRTRRGAGGVLLLGGALSALAFLGVPVLGVVVLIVSPDGFEVFLPWVFVLPQVLLAGTLVAGLALLRRDAP